MYRYLGEYGNDNEQLTPEEIKELVLAQNNLGRNAWHVAAWLVKVEVLDKLWELAK